MGSFVEHVYGRIRAARPVHPPYHSDAEGREAIAKLGGNGAPEGSQPHGSDGMLVVRGYIG